MSAGRSALYIEQGATFRHQFTWLDKNKVPTDISGYTVRMQIRTAISQGTVLCELTTENGRVLILNGPGGKFELLISADVTATFNWKTGVYDLLVTSTIGEVTRLVEGSVTVSPSVTLPT